MARSWILLSLSVLLAAGSPHARAGDEDVPQETKQVEPKPPEDTELPPEPEAPEMSTGDEPVPEPEVQAPPAEEVAGEEAPPEDAKAPPRAARRPWKTHEPDDNIDYSRLLDTVETADAGRGVLAPALGMRGYRPSMIAVGMDDRTPGFGGMVEYSWNRIGAGIAGSYRSTKDEAAPVAGYSIVGLYGLYRWLPFNVSPYFLLGLEAGFSTDESTGGMLGGGVEARIYSGWTILLGWTLHSTIHRGFLGGALGWSF
jgi:hypothetical protein